MEFWKAVAALLRRKSVVLPVIGVALLLAVAAFMVTPVRYVSSTTMVLTTPTTGGTLSQDPGRPNGLTNPLLNFGSGLKTTSAILIQAMNTPEVQVQLLGSGGSTKIVIDDGSSNPNLLDNNGPFVFIQAESSTPDLAKSVVIQAQALIRQELTDRQAALGAPRETYITMTDVVSPTEPEVTRTNQIRMTGVAFAGAFLIGMALAYFLYRKRLAREYAANRTNIGATSPVVFRTSSAGPPAGRRLNGGAKQMAIVENTDSRGVGPQDKSQRQIGQWPRSLGMRRPENRIVDAGDQSDDDRSSGDEPEKSA